MQTMSFHRFDQESVPVRRDIQIVVDVAQELSARQVGAEVHRFGVAEVSIVSNHPAPVCLEELRRAVRRVIVDNDDLVRTGRVPADSFEEELIVTELIVNGDNDTQHDFTLTDLSCYPRKPRRRTSR